MVEVRTDVRVGLLPERLADLVARAVRDLHLDLTTFNILTEAATGAYCVTPVIAAAAGAARVVALAKDSRYGTVEDARRAVEILADLLGVADRIEIVHELDASTLASSNLVTNSGFLRPLHAEMIERMTPGTVIALMFEAWEFRSQDIDADACVRRRLPIVGVNEHHPSLSIFSFLAPACVFHLHRAGIAVFGSQIAVVSNNLFADPVFAGLVAAGAKVTLFEHVEDLLTASWDAVIIALSPTPDNFLGVRRLARLSARVKPWTVLLQLWGDIDRSAASAIGIQILPERAPALGHMGILLSDIGPEAIVRLQAGGLRAAQAVLNSNSEDEASFAQILRRE